MGIMQDKVCVITGGAGSVGLESAKQLRQEGAKVMLVDNNQQLLKPLLRSVAKALALLRLFPTYQITSKPETISRAVSKNGVRSIFCSAMRESAA